MSDTDDNIPKQPPGLLDGPAASGLPLALWLGYWGAAMRYHRYEVHGLSHLAGPRAALVVGYHGRPTAYDMCMLSVAVQRRHGYLPHGIFHSTFRKIPGWRWLIDGMGGIYGDDPRLGAVVARGEHIITVPGGTREAYRSFRQRYQVDWGRRTGYLRFAIKYGLPIIPVGASGIDDVHLGLNDGYRLGKRLGMPAQIPLWLGLGLVGVFPLSLPFPVKIRQLVGPPMPVTAAGGLDPDDREALLEVHQQVVSAVQGLVDRARASG